MKHPRGSCDRHLVPAAGLLIPAYTPIRRDGTRVAHCDTGRNARASEESGHQDMRWTRNDPVFCPGNGGARPAGYIDVKHEDIAATDAIGLFDEGKCTMKKKGSILAAVAVALTALVLIATSQEVAAGRGDGPVVFVRSQNLYYDSIVVSDPLPARGPFQLLEMGSGGRLETDLGPGDPGYVGGRWKEDFDGDGEYHYFLCPLLGPGRANP